MDDLVTYELDGAVATVRMDDGKANVLSPAMAVALGAAFDRAEQDGVAVVLAGRDGLFSGGFDLQVLQSGGDDAGRMLVAGFELSHRLLSFPRPVVAACRGHAVAMGLFLLLSCDHRVGAAGAHRLVANEVAIGLTMPHAAVAVLRHRLAPAAFDRAVVQAATFSPDEAVAAGMLDEVVSGDEVEASARAAAERMAALDPTAHAQSKLRARRPTLDALREGIDTELGPLLA